MPRATDPLTHAENTCLKLAARGEAPDTIARQFGGCRETVEKHLASARNKLLASTTIEAVARALKLGLIR